MNKEEFIKFLQDNGVPFRIDDKINAVYVYEKESYQKVNKFPRKYKGTYIPYLRISQLDDGETWYVRDNGYCHDMNKDDVLSLILKEYA